MITGRALTNSARCANCRLSLLNAFVSAGGLSIRSTSVPSSKKSLLANHASRRAFTQSRIHCSEISRGPIIEDAVRTEEEEAEKKEIEEAEENSDSDAPQSTDSVPWYLQVDPPQRESDTLLSRQQLPELPPDPPPLLQPMLEHIFKDLGLDDVTLLDLRMLDPPPALGANLLMVLATARSEKHLHVSADRFCRWMKVTHRIAPYADGLLGRGELKLKLKRKARRARILSRVGSSETSNTDDGIRTGWICVTVDNIEDGRPKAEVQSSSDDFVGFGGEDGGAKVVIQMLTQEKREDLDLEDLWGKTMRRYERKEQRISNDQEDAVFRQQVGQSSVNERPQRSDLSSITLSSSQALGFNHARIRHMHSQVYSQARQFSTSNPILSGELGIDQSLPTGERLYGATQKPDTDGFLTLLLTEHEKNVRDVGSESAGILKLRAHINFLRRASPEDVRSILGNGGMDGRHTLFLQSFRDSLPASATTESQECHLELLCYGIASRTLGFDKNHLEALVRQVQSSPIEIPVDVYMLAIRAFLTPERHITRQSRPLLGTHSLDTAVSLLEDMMLRGHDLATDEVRSLLELAIIEAQYGSAVPKAHADAIQKLRRLLNEIIARLELRKLLACADAGDWQGVWDIWQAFARDMRPRPAELYAAMIQRVARMGHQAKILDALRVLVPEMETEEPPVQMDPEIAEGVKECLRAVDAKIDEEAMEMYVYEGKSKENEGELHRLWLRCEKVLQGGNQFLREYDDD